MGVGSLSLVHSQNTWITALPGVLHLLLALERRYDTTIRKTSHTTIKINDVLNLYETFSEKVMNKFSKTVAGNERKVCLLPPKKGHQNKQMP